MLKTHILCSVIANKGVEKMQLTEKEISVLKDLQSNEKLCIEKYGKYAERAKDSELKNLCSSIQKEEQQHYDSLEKVINGTVPSANCNDSRGKNYSPTASYDSLSSSTDKDYDCFLATDAIGTEKMVSGDYNSDVFAFSNSDVRKLLADIQVEEQNHAEMLYKYKEANHMTS